jgi:F420H(2)-dependent quinone reductase
VKPLVALPLTLLLAACEPMGPMPGGSLEGQLTPPPRTWTEADAAQVVQLELRPSDPYSINVWGVGIDDDYYVAAGEGGKARWTELIAADPNVLLRIGRDLYPLMAVRVVDPEEQRRVMARYAAKYPEDSERLAESADDAWLFRLDPRSQ